LQGVTDGSGNSEQAPQASARLHRLGAQQRPRLHLFVDGARIAALDGDTVLTAILSQRASLRRSEWRKQPRAGFCLMGVCQDCWIWCEDGTRLRACSTPARADLRLLTHSPLEPAQ
jgi:hypothetical protein